MLTLVSIAALPAAHAVNIRYYDSNRDGVIGPAEYRAFLILQTRIPLSALDRDDDDEISAEELASLAGVLQSIDERVAAFEIDNPDGLDPNTFARQAGLIEPTPERPASWLERRGILVRGNLESLSLFSDAKPLNAASAATLAYSQDINDDQTWSTVKGALMRPIGFDARPNFILLPSVTINRTRYSESTSQGTDTLILRTAIDRLYRLPHSPSLDSVNLRVNPAYITDSHFDTAIVSAEFQLQPSATRLGIGQVIPAGAFQLQWQPSLFAEYGRDLRQGDESVTSGEEALFLRFGPTVELDFWLRDFEQLHVTLTGQHLLSFRNESRSRKRSEASLALALDNAGHLSLQVKYVNGDSSAKLENEAFWTLGLGVKY